MMKHYCGQHGVELSIGERHCLGSRIPENNFEAGLSGFFIRSGQHLRRRVNAVYSARRSDMPFGRDRKGACPAAHTQDGLARFQARQVENLLSKRPLPTERHQPNREIVESGRRRTRPVVPGGRLGAATFVTSSSIWTLTVGEKLAIWFARVNKV